MIPLPNELMIQSFMFLEPRSLIKIKPTNKQFYENVNKVLHLKIKTDKFWKMLPSLDKLLNDHCVLQLNHFLLTETFHEYVNPKSGRVTYSLYIDNKKDTDIVIQYLISQGFEWFLETDGTNKAIMYIKKSVTIMIYNYLCVSNKVFYYPYDLCSYYNGKDIKTDTTPIYITYSSGSVRL